MDLLALVAASTVAIGIGTLTLLAIFAFARTRQTHPSAHLDPRARSIADRAPLSDVRRDDARVGSAVAAADLRAARQRAIDDLQRRLIRTQRGGSWTS